MFHASALAVNATGIALLASFADAACVAVLPDPHADKLIATQATATSVKGCSRIMADSNPTSVKTRSPWLVGHTQTAISGSAGVAVADFDLAHTGIRVEKDPSLGSDDEAIQRTAIVARRRGGQVQAAGA